MKNHLRHKRPTIGVLIGWHVYWNPTPYSYINPIFRGIHAAIQDKGCNLLLACGMGSQINLADAGLPAWPILGENTDFIPVGPWNADGLIVLNPLAYPSLSKYTEDLRKADYPLIFIASGGGEPTIMADNAGGIFQAISHLVKHGHQRIAYLGGSSNDMSGDSGDRIRAYWSAVEQFKLDNDPQLFAYAQHTFDGGYAATQQLLTSRVSFTAILASNDESAMGAMQAIKEAGLQIPQDVAVIGFDDRPETVAQEPPLTSVHIPLYTSGYQAVDLLLQQINGQHKIEHSIKVPTTLTIRQSCGCESGSPLSSDLAISAVDRTDHPSQVVQAMVKAVAAEMQLLTIDEISAFCERLRDTYIFSLEQKDPTSFKQLLKELLKRTEDDDDDAHIWQAVISILRQEAIQDPVANQFALNLLDEARNTISEHMRWQRGRTNFYQKRLINRIGYLTARLLMTFNEAQIFEVLTRELSKMGIQHTSLSFFEAEGADRVAWTVLHAIPSKDPTPIRIPTRQFPPNGLYPSDQPFTLMLMPLVGPTGQTGFITYSTIDIELAGLITQQVAAALNNVKLYREATEGRKLAEEANSLKSRFLSMVSHELSTPLNLIVGLSEMLLQKRRKDEQALPSFYRKDIEQIYFSGQHLGRLIRDVLDLASSQVGQLRLANELLDLGETLEMVAVTGRRMATEKGLAWRDALPMTKLWVWGDRTRLRQIALNLVSNSVKFTTHGEIRLEVEVRDDKAFVVVSDTGLGISPKEQRLIFDEFRRSEDARGYGGLGLGLAISKRLVEMHGGEIGLESTGQPGSGSIFYFSLPLIEPVGISNETHLPLLDQDEMILLLSTQSGSGEQLRNHLLEKGLKVNLVQIDQTHNWLPPLLNHPPGAIILDMAIVPTQGWHVLRTLKENAVTRTIPNLFYSLTKDKGAMLDLDYLTKPVGMAELAQTIQFHTLSLDESTTEKVFLVVDDDPATLEMHIRIMQSQLGRHQVLSARNGREALEIMQRQRPDLVLLDLMMPELDGFGVLEAMRSKESTRDIPVIVLTGQILTEKEMARLNRGVATILSKGLFSVQETLEHIDAALARKRKLGSEAQRLVRQAMAYIHEHYDEPISRDNIADYLGMSNDYLSHCFRTEMGTTPITYLNRYRVNKAKILLAESSMKVTEIAMAVGFSDSSYFGKVFREQVGKSPYEYRRS